MGGKGGGERDEREGESTDQVHTITNTAQQDTTTQGEGKESYKGESGILRSSMSRSPDICQGWVGGVYIQ